MSYLGGEHLPLWNMDPSVHILHRGPFTIWQALLQATENQLSIVTLFVYVDPSDMIEGVKISKYTETCIYKYHSTYLVISIR